MDERYKSEVRRALSADLRRLGMSKKDLAQQLGLSYEAIRRWEIADELPYSRMGPIAEFFGEDSEFVRLVKERGKESHQLIGAQYAVARGATPVKAREDMARVALRERIAKAEFFAALPEDLKVNARREYRIGRADYRLQYLSDHVALALAAPHPPSALSGITPRQVLDLLLLKQIDPEAHRRYILAVILPPEVVVGAVQDSWQKISTECALLGVEATTLPTAAGVAALVAAHEQSA